MNQHVINHRLSRFAALLACAIVALALLAVSDARANLQFSEAGVSLTGPDGTFDRQAGDHPDLTVHAAVPESTAPNDGTTFPGPPEGLRTVDLDLPLGLVGNPTAFHMASTERPTPSTNRPPESA